MGVVSHLKVICLPTHSFNYRALYAMCSCSYLLRIRFLGELVGGVDRARIFWCSICQLRTAHSRVVEAQLLIRITNGSLGCEHNQTQLAPSSSYVVQNKRTFHRINLFIGFVTMLLQIVYETQSFVVIKQLSTCTTLPNEYISWTHI